MNYADFIERKKYRAHNHGFDPVFMPDFLFDFQSHLVDWACKKGRCALFEDCGMGKTAQMLVFAENIRRKHNGNIMIFTPLSVAEQTVREGIKFGIEVNHSRDGTIKSGINVTNYERIAHFDKNDFICVIADESSILKTFAGATSEAVTEFMADVPYRLLASATPAPNDHMELGTSSEALGYLRRVEMLSTFFTHDSESTQKWKLKGHGQKPFWKWMSTWARAIRKPSDLGFCDDRFVLPKLNMIQHTLKSKPREGQLFSMPAVTLQDQYAERRNSIHERCEKVAEIANENSDPFIAWGSFNDECNMMEKLIDGAVQISGGDKDTEKERKIMCFLSGEIRAIVSKPSIVGFGLNFQHCNRMSFFPSHSYEQFYQASRRCWRFGQKRDVDCHIVTTEAESAVIDNMKRKERAAAEMFDGIIAGMHDFQTKDIFTYGYDASKTMEVPKWL